MDGEGALTSHLKGWLADNKSVPSLRSKRTSAKNCLMQLCMMLNAKAAMPALRSRWGVPTSYP